MSTVTTALRNATVAALVAGLVAGAASRDGKTAATAAAVSASTAALGTLLIASRGDAGETAETERVAA